MTIKLIYSFLILIMVYSCRQENHTRTYRITKSKPLLQTSPSQTTENKSSDFSWTKPRSWIASSGSSMRIASFDVPYSNGIGDLSVIQLGGDGGGIEANVNRWRRQLNLESQSLEDIEKDLIKHKGGLGIFEEIQIINEELDSAFLCAILPAGNQTLFVKLSIHPNGLRDIKTEFISFCSSINFSI